MSVEPSDSPATFQLKVCHTIRQARTFSEPQIVPTRILLAISTCAPSRQRHIQTIQAFVRHPDVFHCGFFLDRLLEFPLHRFHFSRNSLRFHRPAGNLICRSISRPSSQSLRSGSCPQIQFLLFEISYYLRALWGHDVTPVFCPSIRPLVAGLLGVS